MGFCKFFLAGSLESIEENLNTELLCATVEQMIGKYTVCYSLEWRLIPVTRGNVQPMSIAAMGVSVWIWKVKRMPDI
jgi:hypothetical protein